MARCLRSIFYHIKQYYQKKYAYSVRRQKTVERFTDAGLVLYNALCF